MTNYGTTTNATDEHFSFHKLLGMIREMEKIQPLSVFASSRMFADDGKAITFTYDRRKYTVAHPNFWKKFPLADVSFTVDPLYQSSIDDIDIDLRKRAKVMTALAAFLNTVPNDGTKSGGFAGITDNTA